MFLIESLKGLQRCGPQLEIIDKKKCLSGIIIWIIIRLSVWHFCEKNTQIVYVGEYCEKFQPVGFT